MNFFRNLRPIEVIGTLVVTFITSFVFATVALFIVVTIEFAKAEVSECQAEILEKDNE